MVVEAWQQEQRALLTLYVFTIVGTQLAQLFDESGVPPRVMVPPIFTMGLPTLINVIQKPSKTCPEDHFQSGFRSYNVDS